MPQDDQQELPQRSQSRRQILRFGWIIAGLILIGGQCWLLLKLFFTPTSHQSQSTVAVGPVEHFPVGSVTHFWKDGFLLVRHVPLAGAHGSPLDACSAGLLSDVSYSMRCFVDLHADKEGTRLGQSGPPR